MWKWSLDGKYAASSTYKAFFEGLSSLLGARELWKTKALPKAKLFFWLALHHRLWTADRRKRHGLQDSNECNLCGQDPESCGHLFLGCVLTRQLWYMLLSPLRLQSLMPTGVECNLADWWLRGRELLQPKVQPSFDSLMLLAAWTMWKERNTRVFRGKASTAQVIFKELLLEAELWCKAGFRTLAPFPLNWSRNSAVM